MTREKNSTNKKLRKTIETGTGDLKQCYKYVELANGWEVVGPELSTNHTSSLANYPTELQAPIMTSKEVKNNKKQQTSKIKIK